MSLKILHLSKMKGVSGSENHLLTLLTGLRQRGLAVTLGILVEERHRPLLLDYQQRLIEADVPVVFFPMRKHLDASLVWRLRQYIRQGQFQLVHTHLIHADLYGTLAAKWAGGVEIVASRHNDDRFRQNAVIAWLNRRLAAQQRRIIVISDWVGAFLRDVEGIPAAKIARIHYGLEPESLLAQATPQYVRERFQIPAHCPIIGTIGRLTEQKGHRYLLQAVQQVVAVFPELRVIIIGDGELRAESQRLAQELKIAANVIFTGNLPHEEALHVLSGLDIFVFPSLWEGFGLVLLEAMAFKKPVVASNVSAIPESVVDGQTGLLMPPRDAAKLAHALTTLLSQRELAAQMGAAGYRYLAEHFTVTNMVDATARLYQQVATTQG